MTTEEKPPTNQALLLRIVQDLADVKAKMVILADHETRIRELEKARWSSAWLISILSAALSSGVVFFIVKSLGN